VADCSDASDAEFEDDDVLNIKEVSDLLNFIKKNNVLLIVNLKFKSDLALKQNKLSVQLAELNKIIAQKEHLATSMDAREEKIIEIKKQCEESKKVIYPIHFQLNVLFQLFFPNFFRHLKLKSSL